MSYKTRLLSALREKQSKEAGIHAATVVECIKLAEEIPEESEWISVKDRPPRGTGKYLVVKKTDRGNIVCANWYLEPCPPDGIGTIGIKNR